MALEEYIEEIKNIEPVIPSEVSDILRGYQKDGMAWLSQLSYLGFGGILADDMGLGKTLQVIAYIHGIKPEKPTLIVAPSALTYNWLSEINKFTPNAKTIIVDGAKEDREKLIHTIGEYEFVITSYPLLRRDIAHYKEFEFSYCFIDEAQHIKNPKTMNARSVKKINDGGQFQSEDKAVYAKTYEKRCFKRVTGKIENTMYAELTGEQENVHIVSCTCEKSDACVAW